MLQNTPGSSIFLATDGLANTGIGSMDVPEIMASANQFYEEAALFAKSKSITINVVGIKGDKLNINNLGKLADITGGSVDIVDPVQITQNFASVLQSKIVATNVTVKLFLHKAFKAPTDGEWKAPLGDKQWVERTIGNAYDDSEITAEFELHSEEQLMNLLKDDQKKEVPFQVQIVYLAPSGMRCLRVISRSREVTTNQEEAEEDVDVPILGMHVNNKTAKLAEQGDIYNAKRTQQGYSSLMNNRITSDSERVQYNIWNDNNANLFQSPVIMAREQQQQQQQLQLPFAAPPTTTQNSGPSIFSTISNFFSTTTVPQPQPTTNNNNSDIDMFTSPAIETYDDSTSNQIYQQKDNRKNKKQWTERRKY